MFSIIIPIYNVSKYLPDCLDSIVNQTYKGNLEVFLVNDGSLMIRVKLLNNMKKNIHIYLNI